MRIPQVHLAILSLVLEITSKTYQPGHVVGVGHVITTLGAGDKPAPLSLFDRIYTLLHHVKPLCPLPVKQLALFVQMIRCKKSLSSWRNTDPPSQHHCQAFTIVEIHRMPLCEPQSPAGLLRSHCHPCGFQVAQNSCSVGASKVLHRHQLFRLTLF